MEPLGKGPGLGHNVTISKLNFPVYAYEGNTNLSQKKI